MFYDILKSRELNRKRWHMLWRIESVAMSVYLSYMDTRELLSERKLSRDITTILYLEEEIIKASTVDRYFIKVLLKKTISDLIVAYSDAKKIELLPKGIISAIENSSEFRCKLRNANKIKYSIRASALQQRTDRRR